MIFKEILVNKTASTSVRGNFDVVIPWDASIATATEAITRALGTHEGFEEDPAPRTLVEAVEPGGIRLRSYFWFPARGVDRLKLLSDAQLSAKVALQKVGVTPTPTQVVVQIQGEDRTVSRTRAESRSRPPTHATDQFQVSLQQDTEAATIASAQLPGDQENEIRHALDNAGEGISKEGRNLIEEKAGS
jgi:hypothetical protein